MTNPSATAEAARLLVEARRGGHRPEALPAAAQPKTVADTHAVQDAVVATLGETVGGWKISVTKEGEVMHGVILGSRLLASPAHISAAEMPLLGIEAEIAFRFDRDLPPRAAPYSDAEVAEAVTALVGIEVVDTRFKSYHDAPFMDRAADFLSNGGFVTGTARTDWRGVDFAKIHVVLSVNGKAEVDKIGGHPAGEPFGPAVAFVNAQRGGAGVAKGRVVTTGSYTGLFFAKPGDAVVARFEGFGEAEIHVDA